jgi:hypothetical protein
VSADELRLMGVHEVAAVLGTGKDNVRRWMLSGELPCLYVGAGLEPKTNLEMLRAWLRHRATLSPGGVVLVPKRRRRAS